MSLRQDLVDIYTKSSVYYLRLQYLVICYLIVLAGAFFVLPMLREMGIDGVARLVIGGLFYIGFAVLMIYAPKLFYPLIGKSLSPYKDDKDLQAQFDLLSESEKRELTRELEIHYGVGKLVIMSKTQRIASNLFFQCLLIELFCLSIFINKDYSLLISNHITQNIADVLSAYTSSTPPKYDDSFFVVSNLTTKSGGSPNNSPFSEFISISESIFAIYVLFVVSVFIRLIAMFVFSRPILVSPKVFSIITETPTITSKIAAFIGTIIFLIIGFGMTYMFLSDLEFVIGMIVYLKNWIPSSVVFFSIGIFNVLICWYFIEHWFKKIIGIYY
ncbi:MAG: hypothetical protein IK065_04040 [Neisseriaceae bacterium]|nr:hypothetical protein [Neisseriaceae bacterium]